MNTAKGEYPFCIPFVGAIIERTSADVKEVLIQTRWKPDRDPKYSGTFEFAAGVMDRPFENVYEVLEREIKEETGLILKSIKGDSRTREFVPQGDDCAFGFRPYCCTQQLREGKPWIGFIFVCEVEEGEPTNQETETRDVRWVNVEEIRRLYKSDPQKFFTLEIPAWEYYFRER